LSAAGKAHPGAHTQIGGWRPRNREPSFA